MMNKFIACAIALLTYTSTNAQGLQVVSVDVDQATITMTITEGGLTSVNDNLTLWISEPDWNANPVALNDEEVAPFIDTHLFNTIFTLGDTVDLPMPSAWVAMAKRGMFAGQGNVFVLGTWTVDNYTPFVFDGSDMPEAGTDAFGDNYVFTEYLPMYNVVEIPAETVIVYVEETTNIQLGYVALPNVINTPNDLEFASSGELNNFEFTLYNMSGQIVWSTNDITDFYSHSGATGIYTYTMTASLGGSTQTVSQNIYFN